MAKKVKKKKSGRKPIEDKAVRFIIYPRQSWIDTIGEQEMKKILMDALTKAYKKYKK